RAFDLDPVAPFRLVAHAVRKNRRPGPRAPAGDKRSDIDFSGRIDIAPLAVRSAGDKGAPVLVPIRQLESPFALHRPVGPLAVIFDPARVAIAPAPLRPAVAHRALIVDNDGARVVAGPIAGAPHESPLARYDRPLGPRGIRRRRPGEIQIARRHRVPD